MSTKKHKRYKLLLDESLPQRKEYPQTNDLHDLKHIKHDLNKGGISDPEVYKIASKQQRILVIFNKVDFKKLIQSNKPTVICLSPSLTNNQVDLKLSRVLKDLRSNEAKGYMIYISQRKQELKREV